MKRDNAVFISFCLLGPVPLTGLWLNESWTRFWQDANLGQQLLILAVVHFMFGFLLVSTARQPLSGFIVVSCFVASFCLIPLQILAAGLFVPTAYLVFSFGGATNVAAILGGFTARAFLLGAVAASK